MAAQSTGMLASAHPQAWRKPARICVRPRPDAPAADGGGAVRRFARGWQAEIAAWARRRDWRFRLATVADLDPIRALYRIGFPELDPGHQLSELSLYRFLRFGECWTVEDPDGAIVAFSLLIHVADARRTAMSAGFVVHPSVTRRGLGTALVRYSSLAAMAAGSRERRGTLKPANAAALEVALNKLGAVCEGYHPRLGGPTEGRLEYVLPLTPDGLAGGQVDPRRLAAFVAEAREGADFRLLPAAAGEALEELYHGDRFRVAAFAPAGLISDEPRLVAVAVELLGYPSVEPRR